MVSQSKTEWYLQHLDAMRCASDWAQVPEAARKVAHKIPSRKEFAHTAQLEAKLHEVYSKSGALATTQTELATTLEQQFSKELGSQDVEQSYIHQVAYGHAKLLAGDYQGVVDALAGLTDLAQSQLHFKYTHAVALKRRVVLGHAYEELGLVDNAMELYSTATTLTIDDNLECLQWAEWLYERYSTLTSQGDDYDRQLAAFTGYHKVVKALMNKPASRKDSKRRLNKLWQHSQCLTARLESHPNEEHTAYEIQNLNEVYEQMLWAQSKFPTADEPNDQIEAFAAVLVKNWALCCEFDGPFETVSDHDQRAYTDRVLTSLRRTATATFHSLSIMRLQVVVLAALSQFNEAIKTFDIYRAYLERLMVRKQSGGAKESDGDDLYLVAQTFARGIDIAVHVYKDSELAIKYANQLVEWIPSSCATNHESVIISKAHCAIANAYVLASKAQHNTAEYERYRDLSAEYFQKSLALNPNVAAVHFIYAVQLAQSGKVADALQVVRQGLLHDGKSLNGWHLMALLLSVQEEFETAIKVVNSALALDVELTDHTRRCQVELKMTQIALIEASHGTEPALEKVPEVLSLYSVLFPSQNGDPDSKTLDAGNGSALQPVKSRRSIFKHVRKTSGSAATTRNAEEKLKAVKDVALLQQVWLWVAGVYRRAGQWTECEQAIVEAENWGATANTHTQLGLLISSERPVHAMQEFESALDLDKNHLGAVLGLAQLILDHWNLSNKSSSPSGLFISEKDKLAAHARIIGLVETLSLRSPGVLNSECFWVLSQLYENNKRFKQSRQALWRSLALEEVRPVRDYACINM